MDFTGVSAFPLTPLKQGRTNFRDLASIIQRINNSAVTSIGILGSTGSYMYLSNAQRANVLRNAIGATDKPVIVGIGDLTLENALKHTETAQKNGASALMLAPVSYQRLTPDEVYGLFYQVHKATDLPIVLYDNPATTGFTFTDDLYTSICALSGVKSVKIPPQTNLETRIGELKAQVPGTAIGISGDHCAVDALASGADLWYSAVAGLLPELALALYEASRAPDTEVSANVVGLAQPLMSVMIQYGSYRTLDALGLISGQLQESSLQLPLKAIPHQTQNMLKEWYELYRGYAKKGFGQ